MTTPWMRRRWGGGAGGLSQPGGLELGPLQVPEEGLAVGLGLCVCIRMSVEDTRGDETLMLDLNFPHDRRAPLIARRLSVDHTGMVVRTQGSGLHRWYFGPGKLGLKGF
jgi:hypothetical protein